MSLTFDMKAEVTAVAFAGFDQSAPIRKSRAWRTDVIGFDSGIEQRQQVFDQPIRGWSVNWSILDQAARDKLKEIHDAARGSFDTFLWLDDDEYLATAEQIATDGSETSYQLQATYFSGETYEWTEEKKDIVPSSIYAPVITHSVDGAQTEGVDYTLDDATGILVFGSAPSAGVLSCTFQYYYRVRFTEDVYDDLQFAAGRLFSASGIEIMEVL